ncbi:hypothetical protein B0H11DRAFT_1941103 [Mycena galericulata]|nr:hypothetical protein B0H11DRAFT_1941103 [Mycena galericulata]
MKAQYALNHLLNHIEQIRLPFETTSGRGCARRGIRLTAYTQTVSRKTTTAGEHAPIWPHTQPEKTLLPRAVHASLVFNACRRQVGVNSHDFCTGPPFAYGAPPSLALDIGVVGMHCVAPRMVCRRWRRGFLLGHDGGVGVRAVKASGWSEQRQRWVGGATWNNEGAVKMDGGAAEGAWERRDGGGTLTLRSIRRRGLLTLCTPPCSLVGDYALRLCVDEGVCDSGTGAEARAPEDLVDTHRVALALWGAEGGVKHGLEVGLGGGEKAWLGGAGYAPDEALGRVVGAGGEGDDEEEAAGGRRVERSRSLRWAAMEGRGGRHAGRCADEGARPVCADNVCRADCAVCEGGGDGLHAGLEGGHKDERMKVPPRAMMSIACGKACTRASRSRGLPSFSRIMSGCPVTELPRVKGEGGGDMGVKHASMGTWAHAHARTCGGGGRASGAALGDDYGDGRLDMPQRGRRRGHGRRGHGFAAAVSSSSLVWAFCRRHRSPRRISAAATRGRAATGTSSVTAHILPQRRSGDAASVARSCEARARGCQPVGSGELLCILVLLLHRRRAGDEPQERHVIVVVRDVALLPVALVDVGGDALRLCREPAREGLRGQGEEGAEARGAGGRARRREEVYKGSV